ncbi:MAG: hypothetical protein M3327_05730 [Actinomycetota bacterium]|nr:hypothetical protein [Actinomycetota bacterium]
MMRYSHRLRLATILALAGVAAVAFAAAASAGKVSREAFHDERAFVLENFCDVPGLTVQVRVDADIRVQIVLHGRDQLAYFLQHGTRTDVLTNLANGKSVTSVAHVTEKDLRVTDNGDGTLTVLVLATGNAVVYGPDGKAIARDPGQTRFELLVDHGGTPTDPSDDEVLDFRVVKDSTGRSDEFCEAVVPALS